MAEARRIQEETGGRPSLDALNRTIEGLESRLGDLMEARSAAPSRRLPPLPGVDRATTPQPGSARMDAELRDISRTLRDLRTSLREDFTASLRDELASLHDMLSHIERRTDRSEVDDETRSELLRISEGIGWLVANAAAEDDSRLMAEFSNLQTMLRGLADAKGIERLEGRFDGIERQLEGFDPGRIDGELLALSKGLDDVKRGLAATDSREHLEEIEERLSTLAQAMETLCTRLPASSKRLDGQMTAIERRIGEIDRNLERIGRRQTETVRDPALERMEARLGELGNALAAVDWQMRDQGTKQAVLLENLETLARRIEKHSDADGHVRLESRLDKLAAAIENIRPGLDREALGEAVSDLAEKIGRIDVEGAERRLGARLDAFAAPGFDDKAHSEFRERFEKLTQLVENGKPGIEPQAFEEAIARLGDRIGRIDLEGLERRIAARVEAAGPAGLDPESRRDISEQFEKLALAIESSKSGLEPRALEEAVARINDRISRIDIDGLERKIAARIEASGSAGLDSETRREIRAQFDKMAGLIENGKAGIEPRALDDAVARINDRIARIDIDGLERKIAARIEASGSAGLDSETRREIRAQFEKMAGLIENGKSGIEPRALDDVVTRINDRIARIDIEGLERRIAARFEASGTKGLDAEARREIRAQFEKLSGLVEGGKTSIDPRLIEDAVARINDRIGQIDVVGAERRIAAKIDSLPLPSLDRALRHQIEALDPKAVEEKLVRRIDALDLSGMEERLGRRIDALEQGSAEARLSAQLSALAAQLDETRRDDSGQSLKKLERQIAELTTLASRPDPKLPLTELEERLATRIEAMSASNDDYVIEAAQHAAEEALKTFAASRGGETDEHVRTITALAADMKALHQASRAEGGGVALDATLKSISDRLDTLQRTPSQPAAREVETPAAKKPEAAAAPQAEIASRSEAPSEPTSSGVEAEDVMNILTRVRARETSERALPAMPVNDLPYAPDRKREPGKPAGVRNKVLNPPAGQGDLIAAARRAAKSAIANAEDMTPSISAEPRPESAGEPPHKEISRRPVYLAAGAILLAILAYPLLKGSSEDQAVAFAPIRETSMPQQVAAPAWTPPATTQQVAAPRKPAPVIASGPSLRDPAPQRLVAEATAASEPPAGAFRMVDADRGIVTGSITPDKPVAAEPATKPARVAKVAEKASVVAPPAAAPAIVEASRPAETPKPVRTASVTAQESPVRTAASVSTEDVLDVLSSPTPKNPLEGSDEPETALRKTEDTALPKQTLDTAAKPPKPLDIPLPAGLKPQALATAAGAGNPDALYEIAERYEQGLALPQDAAKAALFMAEASERGSVPATFQLGSLYEKGTGVDKDPKRAVALYRQAAEAGNVSAMHNLAVMLAGGTDGEKPDFSTAARWFEKAADYGVGDSQFNLAILYARGTGVEHDLTQSYKWFAIAAQGGDVEAAKRRDEVAEALTPEDLMKARKAVSDWRAQTPNAAANIVEAPAEWSSADIAAAAIDKKAIVQDIQSILNRNGFDAGPEDGMLGAKTDAAIRAFQKANGFTANGEITPELVKALLARNNA